MKKAVGIMSLLLAFTIAVNAVIPTMSQSIKDAFLRGPQTASLNDFVRDYADVDDEAAAEMVSDRKEAAFSDGKILIYNYEQLSKIGSGESWEYEDGETATYAADAEYMLARDIPLPRHTVWQLPEGFKGKITGEKTENAQLYDKAADRIYLYNPYQLAVTAMEDRESQPVMSGDADASTFGTGKVICTDEDEKCYLTYGDNRNYVVAAGFQSEVTGKSPSVLSKKSADAVGASGEDSVGAQEESTVGAAAFDGRDFDGQVTKKIGDTTYILIGNAKQLRAIGTNKNVLPAIYQISAVVAGTTAIGNHRMLYCGDADVPDNPQDNFQKIDNKTGGYYASVNQENGEIYLDGLHTSLDKGSDRLSAGVTYSTDANYIIFRDIDLGGQTNPWKPLMFNGTMTGLKSTDGKLWNDASTALIDADAAHRPEISNVYVDTDMIYTDNMEGSVSANGHHKLRVNDFIGVGFFATITNKNNSKVFGVAGEQAVVQNIDLNNVHVENKASEAMIDQSLLNLITDGLGTVLGTAVDALLKVLSFGSLDTDLKSTLSNLLNARVEDPTIYATGAFAGRVYGKALIQDCRVKGTVEVSNVNDRTGGFVGYTEGMTEYSNLSDFLGLLTGTLARILNVVPAVGLGDLVTILLKNALPVEKLIPTDYIAPQLKNCTAEGLSGTIGTTVTDMAGGFVGEMIGTRIQNCHVKDSSFAVKAQNYGGGFCGLARDAVITSTLDDIGLDFAETVLTKLEDVEVHPQSVLVDCTISGWTRPEGQAYHVTGGSMLGGFVGAMANTYAVDCSIDCGEQGDEALKIKAIGDNVGGFAGYATVGWTSSLGGSNDQKESLLGTVGSLVSSLVSTNPGKAQKLLTLMGVSPSAILGCHVYTNGLEVEAASKTVSNKTVGGNNAGGLVGRGDAVYIGPTDTESLTQLAEWNSGTIKTPSSEETGIIITGVKSVRADQNCAGGVAGYVGSAAFQGLLNNVAGLGNFIGFNVRDVSLTGISGGYTVTTGKEKAGGGFGVAVGGTITNVSLNELKEVTAYNRAAGFVAVAGPGELVGTGGLTVNLLGLDRLVKANNLLNVGQGVEVHITDCTVTGIDKGFDVSTTGTNIGDAADDFIAAGFIADSNSAKITNSHVDKLNTVISDTTFGYAGGFVGMSSTGGLAEIADLDNLSIGGDAQLEDGYYLIKAGYEKKDIIGMFTSDPKNWGEYILNVKLTAGDTIKVVYVENDTFTTWYPESGDGYTVDDDHAGAVTVHFSKTKKPLSMDLLDHHLKIDKEEDNLHGLDSFIDKENAVINVNGLVSAIGYLIPSYTNCTTTFISSENLNDAKVEANVAGGFVADLESGTVDNTNIRRVDSAENPKWTKSIRRVYDPDTIYAESDHDHSDTVDKQFAVFNINNVAGQAYGGGFGGKLRSGALADAGKGISILGDLHIGKTKLGINLNGLAKVMNTYVPYVKHAGVYSENGFIVTAKTIRANDSRSGSAGGFAGLMSGAQVSSSDVYQLKNTSVSAPADLESVEADSYFGSASHYAVTGGRFAGGYVGNADIGSAASVGDGLGVLGDAVALDDAVKALSVVVTTIEHSDVQGAPGGFSAIASNGLLGKAGGFAGEIAGAHIQNSHCKNFYYMIGQEAAGGYVGSMKPGDAADLLGDASILGLVSVRGSLASLLEDFVPTIRNSTTSCVPCGGAVRAQASSDSGNQRGCAGGYCGHNEGGSIWGNDTHTWQKQNDGVVGSMNFGHDTEGNYTGERHIATAWRIRSVYGAEYAGGYTGFMEAADTASTGNISLLGGVVKVDNLLDALKVVYPTETNTAVYGPLKNLDSVTWNKWVRKVAKYGGYGLEIIRKLSEDENFEFTEDAKYYYGCNVVAGRNAVFEKVGDQKKYPKTEGGDAGGYVGLMRSGVITNGQSYDMKEIRAMRAAGGYAGSMQTGGLVDVGEAGVSLLGLDINADLGKLVSAVGDAFVPAIQTGSVSGWQSGMTVTAAGAPAIEQSEENPDVTYRCGFAGGYVGAAYGAQIFGNKNAGDTAGAGCNVNNLRYVKGTNAAGGYAGLATAASMTEVGTHVDEENGLLQQVLNTVVSTQSNQLVDLLQATVTTIRNATVDAVKLAAAADDDGPDDSEPGDDAAEINETVYDDSKFGFVVAGTGDKLPLYAGGFVGKSEATVIGEEIDNIISGNDNPTAANNVIINGLRSVDAEYYAGGFFGLADVKGVAEVSGDIQEGGVDILGLVSTEKIGVLQTFRPYVYHSEVNGIDDGMIIRVHNEKERGTLTERTYSGCAGGFGGAMMNGKVKYSKVTNLNKVDGLNYVGGFIGHMGRSGVAQAGNVGVLQDLVSLTAGVIDVFSTHTDYCSVTGIDSGAVINAKGGTEPIAGGFVGYADVSKINDCHVDQLKLVNSSRIAGGFVGKTDMHYLIDIEAGSPVVDLLLQVVTLLVKALYLDKAEDLDAINARLGNLFGLALLSDGNLLYVNLFGLKVSVSLAKAEEGSGQTDAAVITIGDSVVALPCNANGLTGDSNENANVVINLIKGNRTRIDSCSVTGIGTGYDVYGGGATNEKDGSGENGMAGGFVGYNYEGKLIGNDMYYCDVVRGAPRLTGPFSGNTYLQSVYSFNSIPKIEGEQTVRENNVQKTYKNTYRVYRVTTKTRAVTGNDRQIGKTGTEDGAYMRFDVSHLAEPITLNNGETYDKVFGKWNGAKLAAADGTGNADPINVYVSSAKAVLMLDTPFDANDDSLVPDPGAKKDPCIKTIDLTVQKVWNDNNNENGARPDEIKVAIYRQAYDENGAKQGDPEQYTVGADSDGWFIISADDHEREDSATWTRVIKDLPVVVENGNTYTYYTYEVREAPVIGYTSDITHQEKESTPIAKITNTPEKFVIEFKYYDRYHDHSSYAGINDKETIYQFELDGIPRDFVKSKTVDDQEKVYIDFAGLIGQKAVEFSNEGLGVKNLICDYDLWTSQKAAVTALSTDHYSYFEKGVPIHYNTQIPPEGSQAENPLEYHTDYLGKLKNHPDYSGQEESKDENWVNYYDSEGTPIVEDDLEDKSTQVKKIVVWCYNYPRQYSVDIYGAGNENDLIEKNVDGHTIYVADSERTQTQLSGAESAKFYYNQRFGDAKGDLRDDKTGQDNAGFVENYGFPGYTGVHPADYELLAGSDAADDSGNLKFAYWAYDREGTQVASVERDFWYRVTTDTTLYAVYAREGSAPGFSISADTNDTYVDNNGVSRTRLNIFGSVFGAPAYDKNVQKLAFATISLSTQIRDNPEVYTPQKINELFVQYKDQLKDIIKKNDDANGSKKFSGAESYYKTHIDPVTGERVFDTVWDEETETYVKVLDLTLTTRGFIYTVTTNGNQPAAGDATIELTNKNRAHFTANYKTSDLNINGTGSNGNTCMLYCGALKFKNEWSVSTNCLIYHNGAVVGNTESEWP